MHERVVELFDDGISFDNLEYLVVKRRGFCDASLRSTMLGCAHTRANDVFATLVDAVYDTGIYRAGTPPSITVHAICLRIYLMDHEKSRTEKKLALSKQRQNPSGIADAEQALHDIQIRHDAALTELEQLRQSVMQALEKRISDTRL